ncbi:hypothetical protein H1D32_08770 [Anaerobacillus sp. CMMVII]|uniref:CBO0543 family protein n=1 Tax=Anaerobacillus sp. CMMVII TaxID=2755588 RepID=UPI0021B6F2C2|nr:CBO0543 family protein [Anaerobacillus sp. CMMVII]MCT8137840.1 hypothetical protein [Anaerobacillus sp. CMMVII]
MSKDKGILLICWIVAIGLLFSLIPRQKLRNAVLAFLYKQVITWLFGLFVVEKGLIKYPVREFRKAYKGSFSFEYFLYPTLCAIYNLYYPEHRSKLIKFLYLNLHAGVITLTEFFIERYTNLIKYVKWKWYWSYLTMGISYYSSRLFYRWFFRDELCEKNGETNL